MAGRDQQQQQRHQARECYEDRECYEEGNTTWDHNHRPLYIILGLIFVTLIVVLLHIPRQQPPPSPSMRVLGASAHTFELDGDSGSTLRYNIDLNVSVCNEDPESTYLVYHVVATASYAGVPLGYAVHLVEAAEPLLLADTDGCNPTGAPPLLRPASFRGETPLPAVGSEADVVFRREEGEGLFTIDVHLVLFIREAFRHDGHVFREMYSTKHDTRVKLRRPESSTSSSLGRRDGDDVVGRNPAHK